MSSLKSFFDIPLIASFKAWSAVQSFLVSILISAHFGLEVLGYYIVISTIITLCKVFNRFGFDLHIVKNFNSAEIKYQLIDYYLIVMGLGTLLFIIMLALWFFVPVELILIIPIFLSALIGIVSSYFKARNLIIYHIILDDQFMLNFIRLIILFSLSIVPIAISDFVQANLIWVFFIIPSLLGTLVSFFTLYVFTSKYIDRFQATRKNLRFYINLGRELLPFFYGTVGYVVLFNIDRLILDHFTTLAEVAIYDIAIKVCSILLVAFSAITVKVTPVIARSVQKNEIHLVWKIFKFNFIIMFVFVLIILTVFNIEPLIINQIYSEIDAKLFLNVLNILMLGYAIHVCLGPMNVFLSIFNEQYFVAKVYTFACVLLVVLMYYSVQRYGIWGAAISMSAVLIALKIFFGKRILDSIYAS